MLRVADGAHEEVFTFFPDRVVTNRSGLSEAIDLSSDFVDLKITLGGDDFKVWGPDEGLLIDGRGKFQAAAYQGRRTLDFGCGSSAGKGEALWKSIRYRVVGSR